MTRNPDAKNYNKTHLPLELAEERMIVHRDYLAHCLRWSHVIKNVKIGETFLDLGCADGPMGMALYTNKYKPKLYLGCDIRGSMVQKGLQKLEKAPWAKFLEVDLCRNFDRIPREAWTVITCFEMIEHIPEKEVEPLLVNVKKLMGKDTTFFLSTPCFDGKNKAANHVKEWTYDELGLLLNKHFVIAEKHGTFMSQKDLKLALGHEDQIAKYILTDIDPDLTNSSLFDLLRGYYDSNLLSVIFAPLFPGYSRNCLWTLKLK